MKLIHLEGGRGRACALVLAAALTALLIVIPFQPDTYQVSDSSTLSYVKGTVEEVTETSGMTDSPYTGRPLGSQVLRVRLEDGRTVEVVNTISDSHYIFCRAGDKIIVCADEPDNAEPYYTVFNHDRTAALWAVCLVFAALMVIIGGLHGIFSLAALLFSMALLFRFTIPAIYSGVEAIGAALISSLLITFVTVCLISGFTWKSVSSILCTFLGEVWAALFFALFSALLKISGFVDENVEALMLITDHTGLDLEYLLFAAAMIASTGAVMDVAVSMTAAMWELHEKKPDLGQGDLFRSGMRIGRDMMGTMSNTLILAFAGSALSMFLVMESNGVQPMQLLNSDYMAVEIAHGLCGTAAVVATVPISAGVLSFMLPKTKGLPMAGGRVGTLDAASGKSGKKRR